MLKKSDVSKPIAEILRGHRCKNADAARFCLSIFWTAMTIFVILIQVFIGKKEFEQVHIIQFTWMYLALRMSCIKGPAEIISNS